MSNEEEEDWFERALRELEDSPGDVDPDDFDDLIEDADRETIEAALNDDDDAGADAARGEGNADSGEGGEANPDEEDEGEGKETTTGGVEARDGANSADGSLPDPAADDDPFGGVRDDSDGPEDVDDPRAALDGEPGGATDAPADGADPDDPFGGGGAEDPFGGGGADDSFGGGGADDPFGGGGADDPFGGGFGGDDFGFTDFDDSGGAVETFDEEAEFDSNIDRIDVGIAGLDEMILGGVPRRSLMSVIGSAGTGKTTFALQFLNEALKNGEHAVYITLEQSQESIIDTAEEKGWPFEEYTDEGRLAVVALDPIEMANSLSSLRNDLSRLITDFGAERLVLDSVSLLEMMYDHPSKRRSEVFDFTRSLKRAGVTTLLTSEASEESPYKSKHGIVEYLTDAVFVLQYVRPSDFRETRLAVEILKIRDANHSRETKPYEITDTGISVYRQANIF